MLGSNGERLALVDLVLESRIDRQSARCCRDSVYRKPANPSLGAIEAISRNIHRHSLSIRKDAPHEENTVNLLVIEFLV